jgi:hypothetical protein
LANIDNPHGFRPVVNLAGGSVIPTWEGRYASASTVSLGDALYATAGYLHFTATATPAVVGVAITQKTGSATTSSAMLFWPAVDWIVYEGQCSSGTAPAQADVWDACDIEGTSGVQEVNEDGSTNLNVWVIDIGSNCQTNTSIGAYAHVRFTWCKSKFNARTSASLGITA